jgi:hypothetical protein
MVIRFGLLILILLYVRPYAARLAVDYSKRAKLWSERHLSQGITSGCQTELMFTNVGAIWVQCKITLHLL